MVFLLIDTETTGFGGQPSRDELDSMPPEESIKARAYFERPVSISILMVNQNLVPISSYHQYIWEDNWYMKRDAYNVHGLSVDFLRQHGRRQTDIADELFPTIYKGNIVAHNATYDWRQLRNMYQSTGYGNKILEYNLLIDTMKSMTDRVGILKANGKGNKWPKLHELCSYCGVTEDMIARCMSSNFSNIITPHMGFHSSAYDVCAMYLCLVKGAWSVMKDVYAIS